MSKLLSHSNTSAKTTDQPITAFELIASVFIMSADSCIIAHDATSENNSTSALTVITHMFINVAFDAIFITDSFLFYCADTLFVAFFHSLDIIPAAQKAHSMPFSFYFSFTLLETLPVY
jgi:hypothetical protein